MKKITLILAVIACVFAGSGSFAQGIGVGIKAGANFANQNVSDISTDSRTGFVGGAYLVLA
jgi:hypothetical protein